MSTPSADNPALTIFWKNRYAPPAGLAVVLLLIVHMAPSGIDAQRQTTWVCAGLILVVTAVLDVVRPSFGSKVMGDGLPITVHLHAVLSGCWLGGAIWIDPELAQTREYAYLVAVLVLGTMMGVLQFGTLGYNSPILMTTSILTASSGFAFAGHVELALGALFLMVVGLRAAAASSRSYLELLHLRAEGLDRERIERWSANHDPLTAVANRRGLDAWLDSHRTTDETPTHCLFIDLDHFKVVNDTHGHDVGDELLMAIASRLTTVVGDDGVVARLGGDEFVALVLTDDSDESRFVGDIAIEVLAAARRPVDVDGVSIAVSASVGVVPTADDETVRELLRRGDAALYDAKTQGRGRVVLKI